MTLYGIQIFKITTVATLVVALLAGTPVAAQDGYRIVVNPSNPVSSLSKGQVSKLFLEKTTWDDGAAAAPVDLLPASPVREGFSKDVLGLSVPAAVDRMLAATRVAGGNPPPAVASDREVLAYVRLKPGAIGYVSLAADITGVKVVAVGGKTEHALAGGSGVMPLSVGGRIAMPQRIVHAQPVYPPLARVGKVQGTVDISVVIDADGNIERAQVVRSIPPLDAAAVEAVRKWKYNPTIVDGVAVPVTMVVHVTFAL
ncbi:MAG TPA: TonB family protein [Vicinamibacterales bacterium]|nr:TonB family protein [Vicinamibacterales bacterium]